MSEDLQKRIEELEGENLELKIDLSGKMGFVYGGAINQLKRSGFLKYDEESRSWSCYLSDEDMERVLKGNL